MSMFNSNPKSTANPAPLDLTPKSTPSAVDLVPNPASPQPQPAPSYQPTQRTVSGVIGPRMVIKGNIEFEGELLIQGKVQGDISSSPDSKGTLVIEEKAEVEGNVNVPVIKVGGVLRGDVASTELLHITSSGSIEGPVRYNNLQLESGSSVAGSLSPEFKAKPRSTT